MKCQTLFSGENKENFSKCLLIYLPRMLNVNVKKKVFNACNDELIAFE